MSPARTTLSAAAAAGFISLISALPAAAIPPPPEPPGGGSADQQPATSVVREVEVLVDDDALELGQVGLGAVGGLTIAAMGALALRVGRRTHAV